MQQICSVISDSIVDELYLTGNASMLTMIISVDILHAKAPHKEDRMYPNSDTFSHEDSSGIPVIKITTQIFQNVQKILLYKLFNWEPFWKKL